MCKIQRGRASGGLRPSFNQGGLTGGAGLEIIDQRVHQFVEERGHSVFSTMQLPNMDVTEYHVTAATVPNYPNYPDKELVHLARGVTYSL